MHPDYFIAIVLSFALGFISIFLLRIFSLKLKIFTSANTPIIGGLSIGLSFFLSLLFTSIFYGNFSFPVKGIFIASLAILIFGLIDDWLELSVLFKFLAQIIAVSILVFFGIKTHIVGLGSALNLAITFIWVIAITNAFNHLDIIDGLAGSIAVIVSLAFFIVSFLNKESIPAVLSLCLSGTLITFFIYNLPPAKIYMGNSGSHFLGFVLAAIAIVISYAPLERRVALFSPLLILGFPIFDTAFLIFMRISKKRLPFKKSNDHLALKMAASGYSKRTVLAGMAGLGLFFSLSGLFLSQVSNIYGAIIIILASSVCLIITYSFSRNKIDA